MTRDEAKKWISEVVERVPGFIEGMRDSDVPGRYKYSLSGDLHSGRRWGLGNSVFAVKCLYMLGDVPDPLRKEIITYIKSYQSPNGEIWDPLVQRRSRVRRMLAAIRTLDFGNAFGLMNRRAETRQAFAALEALGGRPDRPYSLLPSTKEEVSAYVKGLDWNRPWGAASHFSHLAFFLSRNAKWFPEAKGGDAEETLSFCFEEADRLRQEDGAWYKSGSSVPVSERVNGAMKMVTAYEAAGRARFGSPEKLIDLALTAVNDGHACDNLNVICLLDGCIRQTSHRREEVVQYALDRLSIYRGYWRQSAGGFSFFPGRANRIYYGARVSRGLEEPDIHATHLYLWGIVQICGMLGFDDTFRLRRPVT